MDDLTTWQRLVSALAEGILVVDGKGTILFANHKSEVLFGRPVLELIGTVFSFPLGTLGYQDIELIGHDGKRIIVEMAMNLGAWAGHDAWIVSLHDVSERREQEEQIAWLSTHDSLTGLANRREFEHALEHCVASAERGADIFTLIYLDIDHFKDINDSFGHAAGDKILQTTARRLVNTIRKSDLAARLGGDEFAMVLSHVNNATDVALIVNKIKCQLEQIITIAGNNIHPSISAGISIWEPGKRAANLNQEADFALYEAKESERGSWRFFSAEMRKVARVELQILTKFNRLLTERRTSIAYQPQFEFATGKQTDCEVLFRWPESLRSISTIEHTVSVLEKHGLTKELTELVFEKVLSGIRQKHLNLENGSRVAINISPRELKREGFAHYIIKQLNRVGIPPQTLELEVTERLFLEVNDFTTRNLFMLKEAGIPIALDDFGSGCANLASLCKLPISKLKIEGSFIRHAESDRTYRSLIRAIVDISESFGIICVMEQIETEAQWEIARECGCHWGQGFYLQKPQLVGGGSLVSSSSF